MRRDGATRTAGASLRPTLALPWPLPALIGWGLAWAAFIALRRVGAGEAIALLVGCGVAWAVARTGSTRWRRLFIAGGFPVSLAATGVAGAVPSWAWLAAAGLLLLLYPMRSWRDAPLFPTPAGALQGLRARLDLTEDARILDGGCGLGAGLIELRREFPSARLSGIEWSWPLTLACDLRCRMAGLGARVRRADLWASDWREQDLVYLFQRPESMPKAIEKAAKELRDGAWLVSLEFPAPSLVPKVVLSREGARPVYAYRAPLRRR